MPLRDHFRPPLDDNASWEELHGGWPMVIVQRLRKQLPAGYVAGPRVHWDRSSKLTSRRSRRTSPRRFPGRPKETVGWRQPCGHRHVPAWP